MKKIVSIIVGFILSAALLYFAVKNIDVKTVISTFRKVELHQLIILALAILTDILIRGFRWRMLVSHCVKTTTFKMAKLEAIGLAMNNVLPLRLGELARASVGSHLLKVPLVTLLSTILIERILDLITLSILFLLAAQFDGVLWFKKYTVSLWFALLIVLTALVILIFLEDIINKNKTLSLFLDKHPKLKKFFIQISLGAQSFKNKKIIIPVILSSFALWLVNSFEYWWAGLSLGLEPALSFGKAVLVLCTVAVAVIIPAMPGYFGTFELAVQQVLVSWSIDKNAALAYAGFIHLAIYIVMTMAGIIFLYQTGNTLTGLWKKLVSKKK